MLFTYSNQEYLLYHYVTPTCSLIGFRAELVHCLIG